MITVEREGYAVELEDIGEGRSGDYNEDDPHDSPLLRFYVRKRSAAGELEDVDDASYCTRIPATLNEDAQRRCAQYILGEVLACVSTGASVKKTCERLSWLSGASCTPRDPPE